MRYVNAREIRELLEQNDIYNAIGGIKIELNGIERSIVLNDIVGNALQEWLCQFLTENDIYYRPAIGQTFPDFYLRDDEKHGLLEMKSFHTENGPGFDIANYYSYVDSLRENPYKLDSEYIIFEYNSDDNGEITIKKIYNKKVYEIAGPATNFALNCQRKKGIINNIRPVSFHKQHSPRVKIHPFTCKEEFVVAIYKTILNDTNQTRFANKWMNDVIIGYRTFSGEDMTQLINSYKRRSP